MLGADLLIKGGIEGRGDIQLHGRAWGDVKVERLLVAETAELEGSVEAVVVEVRGRVLGPINARYVKLSRGCQVQGDVTYESLAIEEGAQFEGACKLSKAARAAAKQAQRPSSPASGGGAAGGEAAPAGGPAPAPTEA
jgi:cytoskeletal protein CcmA (bactofilin family)